MKKNQNRIGKKRGLAKEVCQLSGGAAAVDYRELVADWRNFYRHLGIKTDFLNLQIPKKQEGFDRLIIMAQGVTPQRAYDQCKELFPCWKRTGKNLDEVIDFSFQTRSAKNGPYAIWVRNRVEADKELQGLSANNLKCQGITLEERLIYGLKFFKERNKHLDIQNVTLCSGSRFNDGHVPNVHRFVGKVCVGWYHAGNAGGGLRARQVVSG